MTQSERVPEKGLVGRRIGGIALILAGIPVGIFGLLCIPGILFWILCPVGGGMIGQGVLLMFSKRSKKPEEAFKSLFKEAFFNADGTVVNFAPQLFRPLDQIRKRILAMCPINGMTIEETQLAAFLNAFEYSVKSTFAYYGGAETPDASFGVFVDPEVKVLGCQGDVTVVSGTVNIVRKTQGYSQILEVPIVMNMINLGGFLMPVNLIPRLFDNSSIQVPVPDVQLIPAFA